MDQRYIKGLKDALNAIIGKKCWGITAGGGGSTISLYMGEKVARKTPIANPHLREDLRKYDAEIALMVNCSWRLDSTNNVICSWVDNYSKDGPVLSGLRKLENHVVESVDVMLPALDLALYFDHNIAIKVFCDRTSAEQDPENYVLFTSRWNYTVCVRSKIERERRNWY